MPLQNAEGLLLTPSINFHHTTQAATNIEKCVHLLGKQMPQPDTRLVQTVLEDLRREYDVIQNPGLKAV
jgi:hypothetical protein